MAMAVRIVRAHTKRDKIAFCGYHGWHDWYLAANLRTDALGEHLLAGLSPCGVPQGLAGTMYPFRYNRLDELERIVAAHRKELAAVIMEPIRSTWPQPGFLEGVKDLVRESGAVLVFDEISSGFRLCVGGAHLELGVEPDIAVFSKALGNGYPIAAVIGTAEVMESAQKTFISSTNWSERIGPTAALAVIKKFRECNVHQHLIAVGEIVKEGWNEAAKRHGLDLVVAGIAPAGHFNFQAKNALALKAYYIQLMLERGFLASNLFYAMYAHAEEHARRYVEAVDEVFAEVAQAVEQDAVETRLKGLPSTAGFQRLT